MKRSSKKRKLLSVITVLILSSFVLFPKAKSESYIRDRVVKISSPKGMCSGEQVHTDSGADYILTASHCLVISEDGGKSFNITTEQGTTISRRIIAEDHLNDLLLVEGVPGLRGLDVAHYSGHAEHVRTFTHGNDKATYKTEGEQIQLQTIQVMLDLVDTEAAAAECTSHGIKNTITEVLTLFGPMKLCLMNIETAAMTAKIVPGSSGGMVVDDSGDLMGVVSATDGEFGYIVPVGHIHRFLSGY